MLESVVLDKEADSVGRFALEVAFLNVENLVEELAYVEAEPDLFLVTEGLGILFREYPAFVGSGEF